MIAHGVTPILNVSNFAESIAVKQASRRRTEGAHAAALAFVRELIAVGTPQPAPDHERSRELTAL